MNILIVTSSKNRSGGTRQALYLAEALADEGYPVTFFTYPGASIRTLSHNEAITWRELPCSLASVNTAILNHINHGSQNIIHAFHNKAVKQMAYLGSYWRLRRLPINCVAHRGVTSRPGNPLPFLLPGIRAYIVNSALCAGKLPMFWRKSRVHVVNNSIPDERTIPNETAHMVKSKLGIPDDALVLGTIANNNPEKGIELLLRAYALVTRTRNRPMRLVVIGGNPQRWSHICEELRITDEVHFISTQDVADYLQFFTLFVVASYFIESQPNVILEAMSMGLPVVATDVGGIPELLDSQFLYPPRDISAMAAKIVRMLEDLPLRSRAANDNYIRSRAFTTEHRLRAVLGIYNKVIAESASGFARRQTNGQ